MIIDKDKHTILNMLTEVWTRLRDTQREVEKIGEVVEKYVPKTNLKCVKCGGALYAIGDDYICLKCGYKEKGG